MRLHLSTAPDVEVSSPLKKLELQKLFSVCESKTLKLEEYLKTKIALGKKPTSLNLHFCSDKEMRDYQKRFRKLDRTTDILSFPNAEGEILDRKHLGDLIVSLSAIERGAKRGRRSPRSELCEVLVHGWLHLLGCDHVRGGPRAKRMRALQKELFGFVKKAIKL